jgi:predicted nucleotide-binding protein
MGALSRRRTFVLAPQGANLKIPTDLLGLNQLRYEPSARTPFEAVTQAANEVIAIIRSNGSK